MDGATTTPGETRDAGVTAAEITPAAVETGETTPAQTTAAETPSSPGGETTAGSELAASDLAKVRELVLQAHPEVVPDLVRGESIDELLASVEPARSAYLRVAEAVRANEGGGRTSEVGRAAGEAEAAQPPVVPAGGASNVVDPSALAPTTKIAKGLAEHGARG